MASIVTNGDRPQKWRPRSVIGILILMVPALIAYCLGSHRWPPTPISAPPVVVAPETLNFNEAWETDAFRWALVFHNVSDKPVFIRDSHGGCPCTKVEGATQFLLGPKEKTTLNLNIDLLQVGRNLPLDVRPAELSVFAKAGHDANHLLEYHWTLKGKIRRLLRFEPAQAVLLEELTCDEPGRPIEVRIKPNIPIRQLRLNAVPEGWAADLRADSSRSGGYVLKASACKPSPGQFSDPFELIPIAEDGRTLPAQLVRVEGRVCDTVEVLPRALDLGNLPVGTIARGELWISPRNDESIHVAEVVPSDTLAKVIALRQEGTQWRVGIERLVDRPGVGTTTALARVKTRADRLKEILLKVQWYGIAD